MSAAESGVPGNAAAGIRRNNFDLIRLAAAAQVMLVHLSDNLFRHENAVIHLLRVFPGVPIFFLISGFLISASWERNSDWRVYARSRFLRIMPGYWAVFLFSLAAIVFGSGIDLLAHLRDLILWIAAQLAFLSEVDVLRHDGAGRIEALRNLLEDHGPAALPVGAEHQYRQPRHPGNDFPQQLHALGDRF